MGRIVRFYTENTMPEHHLNGLQCNSYDENEEQFGFGTGLSGFDTTEACVVKGCQPWKSLIE